jgi:hypothetical protein
MSLPGFTAEIALDVERGPSYQAAGVAGSDAGPAALVPQQGVCTPCFKPLPFLPGVRACVTVSTC